MLTSSSLLDAATLGLAVAYGPDRHLSGAEVAAVLALLHGRVPGADAASVEAVVRGAAVAFRRPGAAEAAADRLADEPEAVRHAIVGDIAAVAAADGIVQPAEWRLVERIAARLAVAAPPRPLRAAERAAPLLTDLAFLAVALAFGTDRHLDAREAAALRDRLATWAEWSRADTSALDAAQTAPGAASSAGSGVTSGAAVDASLAAALAHGAAHPDRFDSDAAARRSGAAMSAACRARVLDDLTAVAAADASVDPPEAAILARVAALWAA